MTANVSSGSPTGQARKARRVPSADVTNPSVSVSASGAKVAEPSKDLEGFLLGFEQRRSVCADAAQGVSPLGARRPLRMQAERWRVEEDALAFHLLDHGSLREHFLQRVARGEAARFELEPAQLGEGVVLVAN